MNPYWKCEVEPRNTIVCEWLEAWKARNAAIKSFNRSVSIGTRLSGEMARLTEMRIDMTQVRLDAILRIYHVAKENA